MGTEPKREGDRGTPRTRPVNAVGRHWITRRTALMSAAGAVAAVARAAAQPAGSMPRIAVADPDRSVDALVAAGLRPPIMPIEDLPQNAGAWRVFFEELQGLGYEEGVTLGIERWSSLGTTAVEGRAAVIAAILASRPDVVVTGGNAWTRQLTATITDIPVVVYVTDPVALQIAANLARPEGNVTGFYSRPGGEAALTAKHVQLLVEMDPTVRNVAWLRPQRMMAGPGDPLVVDEVATAVIALGVELAVIVSDPPTPAVADIEAWMRGLVAQLVAANIDAVVFDNAPEFNVNRVDYDLWPALLLEAGLPAISVSSQYVRAGLLMSYQLASTRPLFAGMARYVDRILRGVAIADLPFQAATDFALTINRRTAGALGLTIPEHLLTAAAEIIE